MELEDIAAQQDWARLEVQLDQEGHARLAGVLGPAQIHALCHATPTQSTAVAELQAAFYPRLQPIANRWNDRLGRAHRHPRTPGPLSASQWQLSRLQAGGEQALHDRGADAQDFALQLVALLGEPGEDFTGGAFVMTEQRPRMQSRPIVVPLRRGDVAVIAVAQRPHAGSHSTYAVHLRHAIGRVRSGERVGLELLFHAAGPGLRPPPVATRRTGSLR